MTPPDFVEWWLAHLPLVPLLAAYTASWGYLLWWTAQIAKELRRLKQWK
jgi:hypothetical protein